MNYEKMLALADQCLKSACEAAFNDGGAVDDKSVENLYKSVKLNPTVFYGTMISGVGPAAELYQMAREELAKKSAPGCAFPAMKRIIKAGSFREALAGAWETDEYKTIVCDGYRLACIRKSVDALPRIDMERVKPLDIAPILKGFDAATAVLPLPSAGELKTLIAEFKAANN